MLAVIEAAEGHELEARSAGRHATELFPGSPGDPLSAADLDIRAGAFIAADRTLRDAFTYGTRAGRQRARWLLVISLRNQGRLLEALDVARAYRREADEPSGVDAVPVAQVLFELGRTQEAAMLYDSVAAPLANGRAGASGSVARWQSWVLAHAAEAWATLGDTTRVAAYADTIEHLARRSLYGRDRHLPAHLRGLVWLARGNPDSALASLRAAVFSLSIGYTRTNLELGRLLLQLGHPREAALVSTAGLAEAIDGSAYYATRTELHELAAHAFDAAGEADSAIVHYTIVLRAWSHADPPFAARVAAARERLTALHTGEHRGVD
jgi:tetratricopeptide (TPR) repeat protein